MGRAKWRILHVPHGTARHFDAEGSNEFIATGTGSNWKLKSYGLRFKG
jgi:hypothetical protein